MYATIQNIRSDHKDSETVSRNILTHCTRTTEVFNLWVNVEIFSIEVCSVELADVVKLCSDTIYKQSFLSFPVLRVRRPPKRSVRGGRSS